MTVARLLSYGRYVSAWLLRWRGLAIVAAVLLGVLAASLPAVGHAADDALADVLFERAQELYRAGELDQACALFLDSQRTAPSSGTALNLARCEAERGRTATAWATFHEAASLARAQGRMDRHDEAQRQITELEPSLRWIRLNVLLPHPAQQLFRDDVEVVRGAWNTWVPLDPGEHVVTSKAPSRETFSQTISAGDPGSRLEFTVPALQSVDAALEPQAPDPSAAASSAELHLDYPPSQPDFPVELNDSSASHQPRTDSVQRSPAPWIVVGISTGVLITAAVFGVMRQSRYDAAVDACGGETVDCPRQSFELRDTGDRYRNVGNVLAVTGAIGLATGLVWVAIRDTSPRDSAAGVQVSATAGAEGVGAQVSGRF